jgi:hypothetical protein
MLSSRRALTTVAYLQALSSAPADISTQIIAKLPIAVILSLPSMLVCIWLQRRHSSSLELRLQTLDSVLLKTLSWAVSVIPDCTSLTIDMRSDALQVLTTRLST